MNKNIKKLLKGLLVFLLIFIFTATPILPAFLNPIAPKEAHAGCSNGSGGSSQQAARVGGVALDQAATFLANMDDITGAYYDQNLDRIVFVGKQNTTLPEFDKDDLAVAIRAVLFNKVLPAVSIEPDVNNPAKSNVLYYGGIEDTKFGNVLVDADWKMKKYEFGYDENQQAVTSSVPGYKSLLQRYVEKSPSNGSTGASRFVIRPKLVSLKRDEAATSFVFDQVSMEIYTEPLSPNNDPKFNAASSEFAAHHTQYYDQFAQETPSYADAKQLGKIVGVIKWLSDNNIATDFSWASDYAPKVIPSPRQFNTIVTPPMQGWTLSGGAEYYTQNTYSADNNSSAAIKAASEAVNAPKEDINWTFTKDGQAYQSVAVAADAFRSLGSYGTSETDMSFPTAGDMTLAFERSYSSFSGGQEGLGRGWKFLPAQLVDNSPIAGGMKMSFCNTNDPYLHRSKLAFLGPDGIRETFTYNCTYTPDEAVFHSRITDSTTSNTRTLYHITRKDQSVYTFEELYGTDITNYDFRLVEVKDKNGNKISYNYDSSNRLINITDNKEHTITLSYNSNNLISSVADWSGRTVTYAYDAQGNLLTVTDPNGGIETYTYDANFKLVSIKDKEGNTTTVNTYTPEAKLATQKDAANVTETYTYNDTTREVTVADNLGRSEKIKYDEKARILEQTDPALKSVKYTYGQEFAPLTVTDKNNNKVTYVYDANGNITSITYPDTKQVTYEYDTKNRVTRILDNRYGAPPKETKYTYDAPGNLTQLNEASVLTNFTYDPTGEMLTLTDPLNKKTTWTRDSFGNKLTEKDATDKTTGYEYDAIARLKKTTDANSKAISYSYDNNGNVLTINDGVGTTTNVYDKEDRMQKTTLPNNAITEYTYNPTGTLSSVKDPLINSTTYGYDAYQNLTSQKDALDKTTTHAYDNLNRQTQSTTPLGKVAKWEYDANGNLSKRIDENNKATNYIYDAFNRLTKITYPDLKTVTYTYDFRGNILTMVDPVGTTTYIYDSFDRLTKVTNPYGRPITYAYDTADNLTSITYPDSRVVTYTYDSNNRISTVKDWNDATTSYTYHDNGLLATKTPPSGVVSSYTYDSANRISAIEHKKSSSTVAKFAYERDNLGNITKSTEEGSFLNAPTPTPTPTTSGQDLVITGISTSPVSPAAGSNYTLSVTVKNQGTAPTGDVMIRVPYYYNLPSSPTYTTPVNYSYSTNVNLAAGQERTLSFNAASISTSGNHTIWAMVDQSKTVPETNEDNNSFGPYDVVVGQTSSTPTPTATPTPTSAITPTPVSGSLPDLEIIGIATIPTSPASNTIFTTALTVKNQGAVSVSASSILFGVYYDHAQAPTYSTAYDNAVAADLNLSPGQSTVINVPNSIFRSSGTHNLRALADRNQTLTESNESNNVGGPLVMTIASNGGLNKFFASIGIKHLTGLFSIPTANAQTTPLTYVTTFTYDPLSRIKTAEYPKDIKYGFTYDKVDNRLTMNVASASGSLTLPYTYNNDNQLTNMGTGNFTYDNNGNQIGKTNSQGSASYVYNFENRMTKYTPPTGSATTYTYDGSNNRLAKTTGFTTTRFVTDTLGELPRTLAETNSSNSITKSYVYGLGLISQGQTGATSRDYYLEDGLGNVRFVTDEVGNKVRSTEYDPFGNWHSAQGQANIHMLFQEQQQDPESSLYYMRARYYDPQQGRFISKDPIKGDLRRPQTQNPYAYSLNNPINLSDPSGESVGAVAAGALFACTLPVSGTTLAIAGAAIGTGYLLSKALPSSSSPSNPPQASQENRNPKQDHKLTKGEIDKLEKAGYDVHGEKGKGSSKYDLYKDDKGNIIQKPKGGQGDGEPLNINIRDL